MTRTRRPAAKPITLVRVERTTGGRFRPVMSNGRTLLAYTTEQEACRAGTLYCLGQRNITR
jgi:hypothetical protein